VAAYFGAEDFVVDMGGVRTASNVEVLYARSRLVLAGRLARVAVVDQVVADFRDDDRFRAEAADARAMGFAGKLCIHPAQVALANAAFSPSEADIARATAMLAAYDAAAPRAGPRSPSRVRWWTNPSPARPERSWRALRTDRDGVQPSPTTSPTVATTDANCPASTTRSCFASAKLEPAFHRDHLASDGGELADGFGSQGADLASDGGELALDGGELSDGFGSQGADLASDGGELADRFAAEGLDLASDGGELASDGVSDRRANWISPTVRTERNSPTVSLEGPGSRCVRNGTRPS
jgi:hypothetical protein